MIGTMLNQYRVDEKIGQGGMGEVYRAHDTRLGRDVALKFLPDAVVGDAERLARFEREARLLASLNHPAIASIHGFEHAEGKYFLVLELVEGEDLAERIARGPLPVDEALAVAIQITEALQAAHERGVVHRDLKPGNVKLTPEGKVKVLDFGLAKAVDTEAAAPDLSQSPTIATGGTVQGVILGTAAYMSPEQARGRQVDKRADVWAFGCVLYEMLTGRQAFGGETVSDTMASILKTNPDWSALPATTPAPVRRLLRRCLAKDRDKRLHDIADARIEIVERGDESASPAPGAAAARPATRWPWLVAATLGVAAVLFAALYTLERRHAVAPAAFQVTVLPEAHTTFGSTSNLGESEVALSPSGDRVAFLADSKLWVRPLDANQATVLAEHVELPFWSGDGRSVGFPQDGKLKRVSASGGPIVTVCDAPQMRGATWNRDNVIVFAPDLRTGLYRVDASGGTPVAVTHLDPAMHSTHRWPQFLPDGRHVLYLAAKHSNPRGRQTGIYVTALDGSDNRRLVSSDGPASYSDGYLLYMRDGAILAQPFDLNRLEVGGDVKVVADSVWYRGGSWFGGFSASAGGILVYQPGTSRMGSQLTWFDLSGKALGTVGQWGLLWDVRISPDGRRAALAVGNPEPSIWLVDLTRNVQTRFTEANRFCRAPVWSPDGTRIAYAAMGEDGRLGVYEKASNGVGSETSIGKADTDEVPTSWSPDGRILLCDHGESGQTQVWVLPLDGSRDAVPLVQTPPWDGGAQFSPDGKWVAYQSRETGSDQVYLTPFPGPGGKWQVSSTWGSWPQWMSGSELLYWEQNTTLWKVSVTPHGDGLDIGKPVKLFSVATDQSTYMGINVPYAPAASGNRVLIMAGDEPSRASSGLSLLINWPRLPSLSRR